MEGGEAGQFVWRDGPLLKALKAGHWIVLDEVFCCKVFSVVEKQIKVKPEFMLRFCLLKKPKN